MDDHTRLMPNKNNFITYCQRVLPLNHCPIAIKKFIDEDYLLVN